VNHEVICGDALIELPKLAERGVVFGACIADPPYGTTACAWDSVIPFAPMWACLKQVVKRDGATVLFGSQPFTSALVMSNPTMFRYELIWEKVRPTGFLDANRKPLKAHDNVLVFYAEQPTYNPQMTRGATHKRGSRREHDSQAGAYGSHADRELSYSNEYYPRSVVPYSVDPEMTVTRAQRPNKLPIHPTQKPVELMRYLIRTYTNEGDTVLDFTAGSFSTGVACVIERRNFIGIEQSEEYCAIGEARMKRASGEWAEIPRRHRKPEQPAPLFELRG
jgi:hypothetical protein